MKILYIAPSYTYGNGLYAVQVRNIMRARGHETELFHAPSLSTRNLAHLSFAVTSVIKAALRRKQYDIVHAFNVPAAPAMRVARAKRRVFTNGIVFADAFGIQHPRIPRSMVESLELRALAWADVLTTDADYVSRECKKNLNLDFEVLLGPLDTSRFEQVTPKKRRDGPVVVYVGRDSVEKGIHILRKAEPSINARVEYYTTVPWADAMGALASADVFVHPSFADSIPNAVKEAQFLGVPVVATDACGIPEIIEHEKTGLLVRPGDPKALATAVNRLLADPELGARMAKSARQNIIQKFTSDALGNVYEKFYQRISA